MWSVVGVGRLTTSHTLDTATVCGVCVRQLVSATASRDIVGWSGRGSKEEQGDYRGMTEGSPWTVLGQPRVVASVGMGVHRTRVRYASRSSRAADNLRRKHDDYYAVLGVRPSATQKEVKSAYYKRSLEFHPDHNPDCNDAAQKYQEVATAYEVLGQEHLRSRYDRSMAAGSSGPAAAAAFDPRMREYRRGSTFEYDVLHVGSFDVDHGFVW
eukprot:m.85378 g.85378  ORF g.85378 m.85378 type:complete len:212 (+) comp9629_c0_seq5:101-736(+)